MSFFAELRRRNVVRVGIAYVVGAWLLLQFTEVLSELLNLPEAVGPVVVAAVAIGFPVALFFAWAFELTPEGIKRETDVAPEASITPKTGRKLDRVIIVLLVLVVAGLLFDEFYLERKESAVEAEVASNDEMETAAEESPSIAVLPFVNMSNDPDNEYFSDGLTETLLHMLAQLPELRVAARTSSFSFKNQNLPVDQIAEALNVAHILEGSVQRAGGQVRVTAQLIRADDGFHLWSQNYTRPLEDIFAIQDEIATDVANALDASLLGEGVAIQGPETTDLDAYETYLKALDRQVDFSYVSLEAADSLFKQSLAKDPAFLDAQIGLARNNILMHATGLIADDELFELQGPLLERIRRQHPENPQARAFELVMQTRVPGLLNADEMRAIRDELASLLAVIPDEEMVRWRTAQITAFVDDDDQAALEIMQAGLLVDPRSAFLHSRVGEYLMNLGRYEESRRALEYAIELNPELPGTYSRMGWLAEELNDLPGRFYWLRKAIEVDPQDHELPSAMAQMFYELGLLEEGDRWKERVSVLVPGSDFVSLLEVQRAEANNDWELALSLSQQMIAGGVTHRESVRQKAMSTYTDACAELGRSQEAFEFFAQLEPEAVEFATPPSSPLVIDIRMFSLYALSMFGEPNEVEEAWRHASGQIEALGWNWRESAMMRLFDRLFYRDLDGAVIEALAVLDEPLARDVFWVKAFEMARLRPVAEDPTVAARLTELNAELDVMRDEVIALLESPEWQ